MIITYNVDWIADVGIPETPTPPSIGKCRQWGHPSPLKHADILNGWSLSQKLFHTNFISQFIHLQKSLFLKIYTVSPQLLQSPNLRAHYHSYNISRIFIIHTRSDSYKMTSKSKGIAYEFIFFVHMIELLWKRMNLKPYHTFYTKYVNILLFIERPI